MVQKMDITSPILVFEELILLNHFSSFDLALRFLIFLLFSSLFFAYLSVSSFFCWSISDYDES